MNPTFLGQEVMGSGAAIVATPANNGVQVSGVLTGSTVAEVTAAQNLLASFVGLSGPLVVPTGVTSTPSASGLMPITGPIAAGGTSLPVASAPGVQNWSIITLGSNARPGIMETVGATGPISNGAVPISATMYSYEPGDFATTGPLVPCATLMPGGPNTPLPGNEAYPGWDNWPSVSFAPGLFFEAITGGGHDPYQCVYIAQFTNAIGGPDS